MQHTDMDNTSHAPEKLADLDLACKKAMDMLAGIQRGDRTLEAMDPDVYIWGEWVGDIDFIDETNLQDDVLDACTLLHRCLSAGRYDLVLSLGQTLLELKVQTDDDSGAFDALDLTDLGYLYDVPVATVLVDMMQAEYRTREHPQEAIRKLMGYPRNQKMRLKDLLNAMGGVPENFNQFLQGWLEMVSQKTDSYSVILTEEAIQLLPDLQAKLDICRACAEKSPQFYLTMVGNRAITVEQSYQIALDGVQQIPENYKIRGTVALEAAALAVNLDLPRQDIETLWREAFRSDTSPLNYLRLLLNAEDPAAARDWMDTVLAGPLPEWKSTRWGEPEHNYMSSHRMFQFRVLKGDFQGAVQPDLWRDSASYQVPLLFAVLLPVEPASLLMKRIETEAMSDLSFDPKVFWMGVPMEKRVGATREQVFRDCLRQWKDTIAFPSPEEGLQLLDQIEAYIAESVASSLQPSRRKEYRSKAELVAKYGEIRELLGEQNGKQKTMRRYAEMWGGHSAFLRELQLRLAVEAGIKPG